MPMTKAILFFFGTLFLWWHVTSLEIPEKKKVASFTGDAVFSFLSFSFLFQLIFHLSSILKSPYELMMLSAQALEWGLIFAVLRTGWTYKQKAFDAPVLYKGWIQFLVMAGIVNHLYYAFLYGQARSLISAVWMLFAFLLLFSKALPSWLMIIFPLFITFGQWLLFMNRPVLFFEYIFPSLSFVFAASLWTVILMYQSFHTRRSLSSE